MNRPRPTLAIADPNTLSAIGLQKILTEMMPMVEIRTFGTFEALQTADDGQFAHYFIASRIYFEHTAFFRDNAHQSIVLVNGDMQIQGVPTLNVCQNEKSLVKSIMSLHSRGHHHAMSQHPGYVPPRKETALLSPRETEVTVLLAKGLINKEIADQLNISITTVITHRKNIMEKLGARSLVDIIIYAVINGLVDVGEL
ncbi:MAG: response regulator transcription factor [Prevotella sp.]|nr:response regulator transcription factor [Prevotella sp.]